MASGGGFDAQDLGQRGAPDLELLLGGLARAHHPLDLVPGLAQQAGERVSAWRSDQAKTSTATAALPSATAASAAGPRRPARRAATLPTAAAASIGATRFEPQRSCSLSASAASPSSS